MFTSMAEGSLTLNSSKVLGLKRFVIALLTLLEKKKDFAHFIVIFMIFFLQEDDKIIDLVNKYGLTNWSHCKVFF